MTEDEGFARFIKDLLCRTHEGDEDAAKRLDAYYQPTDRELEQLCLPPDSRNKYKNPGPCTEPTKFLLIDVPAYVAVHMRKRKKSQRKDAR